MMSTEPEKIKRLVLTELSAAGLGSFIPAGVSARHVHLSENDFKALFGNAEELHVQKMISQPGQFAAREQVSLIGPKGRIDKVRILGPFRSSTQVEISLSDAFALGKTDTPVRLSGDLAGTPGIKLEGPKGTIEIKSGLIVAERHAHFSESQAKAFKVSDKDVISVKVEGARPCIFEGVICRCGNGHDLELHIDTDEANACGLKNGSLVEVIRKGENEKKPFNGQEKPKSKEKAAAAPVKKQIVPGKEEKMSEPKNEEVYDLLTEQEVRIAYKNNKNKVFCSKKAIITPAARDAAAACEVEIVVLKNVETQSSRSFGF